MTRAVRFFSAALVLGLVSAASAKAQEVSVDYEVGVVSDYRYRGYSLSDEKGALQGGVTASLSSGWYGAIWGSSIAEYGVGSDGDGAHTEVDLVLGRSFSIGDYTVDAAVAGYLYPDGTDVSFAEIPVSISRQSGDWRWTAGAAYAPSQEALGHEDNSYIYGAAAWTPKAGPWTFTAQAGRESGAFAPGGKWDWQAGAERTLGPVTIGAAYVDTDAAGIKGTVVATLKAAF